LVKTALPFFLARGVLLLLLLRLMLVQCWLVMVVMVARHGGVLGVISLVDDLRHRIVLVDELREVITAVRATVRRVLDRRPSRADELLQVRLGRQSTLLQPSRSVVYSLETKETNSLSGPQSNTRTHARTYARTHTHTLSLLLVFVV